MDYNTDGKSSFKEFLFAYVGWVGTAEEDEEEEDEEEDEEEGNGDSKQEGGTGGEHEEGIEAAPAAAS